MVNIITIALIQTLQWLSPTKNITDLVQSGGDIGKKIIGGQTSVVPVIGEEMFIGDAPF